MMQVVSHVRADRAQTFYQKTNDNVELSTWNFDDAMAFVGASEYALAA